jgi:MarR family transcriptional regulator, transcriptional regulator for hemolysin
MKTSTLSLNGAPPGPANGLRRAPTRPAALPEGLDSLGLLVHGVAKCWREELDRRLRPLGLTRVQWQALLMISRAVEGLTQRELGDVLDIGAPATVALVDRMERDGLVERTAVPGDRRRNSVRATAASRRLFTRIEATAGVLRQEILGGFSTEELRTLQRLLTKAKQRIEAVHT